MLIIPAESSPHFGSYTQINRPSARWDIQYLTLLTSFLEIQRPYFTPFTSVTLFRLGGIVFLLAPLYSPSFRLNAHASLWLAFVDCPPPKALDLLSTCLPASHRFPDRQLYPYDLTEANKVSNSEGITKGFTSLSLASHLQQSCWFYLSLYSSKRIPTTSRLGLTVYLAQHETKK